jgi:hypothetical protein
MRARLIALVFLLLASTGALATELPLPSSQVLHFMRSARAAYVFRPRPGAKPQRDDKRLRQLSRDSRDKVIALLGRSANWEQGLFTIAEWPPNLGLLFRSGDDELVLYCGEMIVEGSFRGQHVMGCLTERASELLQDWKEQYAKREIQGSHPFLQRPKYRR